MANAGQAACTGYAPRASMSPAHRYQVVWPKVTYTCYDQLITRWRGEMIDEPKPGPESSPVTDLARSGAIRAVTAYATPGEFAAGVALAALAEQARRVAADAAEGIVLPPAADPAVSADLGEARIVCLP